MADLKPPKPGEVLSRQFEEQIYEAVAQELASGVRKEGLWLKAVADAEGSDSRAKALYIRYRAQAMLDDAFVQATTPPPPPEPPGDIAALYLEGNSEFTPSKRDGRVECFACHSTNFTDLGRVNPHCGKCRVPLA
jgi:hypothetical protein